MKLAKKWKKLREATMGAGAVGGSNVGAYTVPLGAPLRRVVPQLLVLQKKKK